MKARSLLDRRITLRPTVFAELVLWDVPAPVPGSAHNYKYRLALVSGGVCVLRYDNEAGKGDHVHVGTDERPYRFEGVDRLIADFEIDVRRWLDEHGDS
ncbi:toxin-antitoxin system TumE family protein [Azospirillum sp. ST 5-10]|uniref:toxin-antitoxin system TumE family protein n=1 Tax=unclassified Azospirillum TaxID=2630922 RepID=UPI003F4A504E